MGNMNIFGGQGYLTDEQRKKPLQHGCDYFNFESCIDLSKPIRVIPYGNATEFSVEQYSRDVASFFCWWTYNIRKDLNGFSGFHNTKFELVGFVIK
jgi:hypothetical protein